jgi:hypothetical protein
MCVRDGIFTVGRNKMCCGGLTKQQSANSTKGLNLTDRQNRPVRLKLNKRGRKIKQNDKIRGISGDLFRCAFVQGAVQILVQGTSHDRGWLLNTVRRNGR